MAVYFVKLHRGTEVVLLDSDAHELYRLLNKILHGDAKRQTEVLLADGGTFVTITGERLP